ncbi:hypothetical protein Pcinc_041239 [Petrolisthes cinctipes]|uniref:Uncharacterized protein n=1 Tax=Petrolisthes cinctipes TaxID=88211 RepID=A0AAE1EHZ2_PETCI|nr:hypothetical protein Pcinc_041239 [Petrolisthes cinctipes]
MAVILEHEHIVHLVAVRAPPVVDFITGAKQTAGCERDLLVRLSGRPGVAVDNRQRPIGVADSFKLVCGFMAIVVSCERVSAPVTASAVAEFVFLNGQAWRPVLCVRQTR